jgi:hypothetical protein
MPWGLSGVTDSHTPMLEDNSTSQQNKQHMIDDFIMRHPLPQFNKKAFSPRAQLTFPVIIAQCRSKDKKRGFMKVYAPVLQDCGIHQETFIEFLAIFHQSSKEDPW